jgi:hypothetical protein
LKIIEVQASAPKAPSPASPPAIVSAISLLVIALHFLQNAVPCRYSAAFSRHAWVASAVTARQLESKGGRISLCAVG